MNLTTETKTRIRGASLETVQYARELRRAMTKPERILWGKIRNKQIGGLRFRSQHPMGPFILDFYCPSCRLVVELDGASHEGAEEYDRWREGELRRYGYRIIRFTNEQVLDSLAWVLEAILHAAQNASTTHNVTSS